MMRLASIGFESRSGTPRAATLGTLLMLVSLGRAWAGELPCCEETEIEYANGDVRLAGVLLQPVADGEFPAAVVLQGSGTSDRNNAWARLVAETLVAKGVAVLLTDKRGSGRSGGDWRSASFADLARDALAGVAAVKGRDGIREDLVGLLGLSQGGRVAPLAASLGDVRFVIDLAGGVLPMKESLFHELEQTYRQHGLSDAQIDELQRMTELSFAYLESGEGFEEYRAYRDRMTSRFGPQATASWPAEPDDDYWTFWRLIHDFDPMPYWREVVDEGGIPSFVAFGELDELDNVPVAASVERLESELEGESLTVRVYPGVGHSLRDGHRLTDGLVRDLERWLGEVAATTPFADDLEFLRRHTEAVVLADAAGRARVIVAPGYQGRVMTSTDGGPAGSSFGWINRPAVASGERQPHMNVFGGEDRFWLGPEGGQFGLYFAPGDPFDLSHWQVPEPIDWGGWPVVSRARGEIRLSREIELVSYAETTFRLRADRTVRVLERDSLARELGVELPDGVELVAYESVNSVTNTGPEAWAKPTGLPSIWILGMYNPSPATTVVIPFRAGAESALGPVVNDAYFGRVPAERLAVGDGVVFFRGDGLERGKIGIPRPRARPILGSWDADGGVLTLVQYTLPDDARDYVNSMWEIQAEPYGGDVVNSYNDGPPEPGAAPLGPFYELETSSPAAALGPGESLTHVHRTVHLSGERAALDAIARRTLGVGLERIESALP